ncbi:MAG: 5-formyltetrahydrofolate cyclo-ligase [Chitinophagaceae bacterium]|jgi:5-formyltetrahydrofolate cyclo-ligase|nr:5-formyltetrahydrofolate cyclo-ligase [Chitinophagaceae bacterium]
MNKHELRNIYKEKRKAISSKDKLKLDDLMLIQFQRLAFSGVETLLTYFPMVSMNEPNTHLFSGYLQHVIPHLRIAYPVCDFENNTMNAALINEETVYVGNAIGIKEPEPVNFISPGEIDLIFVPLLTCDMQGYRVGYGKGFYDKFLAECRENILKTGFNYYEPVNKIDDIEPYDVPLNYCITPYNIYEY